MNLNAIHSEWNALKERLPDALLYFLERGISTNDPCLQQGVYYTWNGGCFAYWVSYFTEERGYPFGPILCGVSCRHIIKAWETRSTHSRFRTKVLLPLIRAEQQRRKEIPVHVEKRKKFLRHIAVCVRGYSDAQIERAYGCTPQQTFELFQDGLTNRIKAFAAPPPSLAVPLVVVTPGKPLPNMHRICADSEKRWQPQAPKSTSVVVATRACGNLFGVMRTGNLPKPLQATHDLAVAQLFTHYLEYIPDTAERWVGEDAVSLKGRFQLDKKPDAYLFDGDRLERVIEVIGLGYTPKKLTELAVECDRMGVELALH